MNPRFPIYIPSKGRARVGSTFRVLQALGVPARLIVEEALHAEYAQVFGAENLLVLDPAYQRDYETCDDLGDAKSKGAGPARNFAWDHAISEGHEWHWVMDDNIKRFFRMHENRKIPLGDGTGIRCMEDFCERYENLVLAGPQYDKFAPRKMVLPPVAFNTRIYSCSLIRNDIPLRWRGRYNEDTIISLDVLKAGYCTAQFNAFLQLKLTTQLMKGGNTDVFYSKEGTLPKSRMLVAVHGDVARLKWRYGRWHHTVNYGPFKGNKLKLKDGVTLPDGTDEYGMKLIQLGGGA